MNKNDTVVGALYDFLKFLAPNLRASEYRDMRLRVKQFIGWRQLNEKSVDPLAIDNWHVAQPSDTARLEALVNFIMVSDPFPGTKSDSLLVKDIANEMAVDLGYTDWAAAWHAFNEIH